MSNKKHYNSLKVFKGIVKLSKGIIPSKNLKLIKNEGTVS